MNAATHGPWNANPFGVDAYFADANPHRVAMTPLFTKKPDPETPSDSRSSPSAHQDAATANSGYEEAAYRHAKYEDPACDEAARPCSAAINPSAAALPASGELPVQPGCVDENSPFSQVFEFSLDMREDADSIGEKQRHATNSKLQIGSKRSAIVALQSMPTTT